MPQLTPDAVKNLRKKKKYIRVLENDGGAQADSDSPSKGVSEDIRVESSLSQKLSFINSFLGNSLNFLIYMIGINMSSYVKDMLEEKTL